VAILSLTGARDAQLSIKRGHSDNVIVELEYAKDRPQGDHIASRLEPITVGTDEDGEAITSCVTVPVEINRNADVIGPRLSPAISKPCSRSCTMLASTDYRRVNGIPAPERLELAASARLIFMTSAPR
jgi:hypothetical protein